MTADTKVHRVRTHGFARAGALLLAIGAFACVATPALAERSHGIDCGKASTTVEKTVCDSAEGRALDQKLSLAYEAALRAVSPEGRLSLRDGQRQWLKMVNLACDRPAGENYSPDNCVLRGYQDRLERLERVTQLFGDIVMRRADIYAARKVLSDDADDDNGAYAGFTTLDITYPQIDAPKTASQVAFNKAIETHARQTADYYSPKDVKSEDQEDQDMSLRYDQISVSRDLISVDFTEVDYVHGTPHPTASSSIVNWLVRESRVVAADDVFRTDTDWKAFLRSYCFRELNPSSFFVATADDLRDLPANPEGWKFSRAGLTIRFEPEEVASRADGEPEVTIPWSALKPYLKDGTPPSWAK